MTFIRNLTVFSHVEFLDEPFRTTFVAEKTINAIEYEGLILALVSTWQLSA